MNITYESLLPIQISSSPTILEECSKLYSENYGVWSNFNPENKLRGRNIKLSVSKLSGWFNNNSSLYIAKNENREIIGYAIAFKDKEPKAKKHIAWVSQLVVHKDYRNSDVAKNLLYSIWGESKNFAWGILSANPYAIRALEKATRRRCNPKEIEKNIEKVMNLCKKHLPYVNSNTTYLVSKNMAAINTQFYVDHMEVPKMIENVTTTHTPWLLGSLEEGWEWIGVTFNSQKQIELSAEEIKEMIETSDMVTKKAYARMLISKEQKWMEHTCSEVDYIVENLKIPEGGIIYDFGCGVGRHVLELKKRGYEAYGVDYLDCNIEKAKSQANNSGMKGDEIFHLNDCRTINLTKLADAIICVYDVIGSFIEENDNIKIIKNIVQNLKDGGKAIISVMNYEMTEDIATQKFSFAKEPNKLLELEASQTMEKTGDVFNPNFFMVDTDTHVVYRKERFESGELPTELIVRDRRFSKKEICDMCEKNGLTVKKVTYVNAKDWREERISTDIKAKEILLICEKAI